jgi:hypothetical protein
LLPYRLMNSASQNYPPPHKVMLTVCLGYLNPTEFNVKSIYKFLAAKTISLPKCIVGTHVLGLLTVHSVRKTK